MQVEVMNLGDRVEIDFDADSNSRYPFQIWGEVVEVEEHDNHYNSDITTRKHRVGGLRQQGKALCGTITITTNRPKKNCLKTNQERMSEQNEIAEGQPITFNGKSCIVERVDKVDESNYRVSMRAGKLRPEITEDVWMKVVDDHNKYTDPDNFINHPQTLKGYTLEGCKYTKVGMPPSFRSFTFDDCAIINCGLWELDFENVSFKNCIIKNTSFYKSRMQYAEFEDCHFEVVNFTRADLLGATFKNCTFNKVRLCGIDGGRSFYKYAFVEYSNLELCAVEYNEGDSRVYEYDGRMGDKVYMEDLFLEENMTGGIVALQMLDILMNNE